MKCDFKCIAGKCKHNCCIGWEIDIDDETYEKYMSISGDMKGRFDRDIVTEYDGTHHFRLGKNDRCPFLNADNLCDIIINLGEDYLCDICREHPRFYVERDDEMLMGYGLCCEEAGRLILLGDGNKDNEVPEEIEQFCNGIATGNMNSSVLRDFAFMLLDLEQLGDKWSIWIHEYLDGMLDNSDVCRFYNTWNKPLCRLMDYLMYRHDDPEYCAVMWRFLVELGTAKSLKKSDFSDEDIVEICRVYSSEIEYSDENVGKITEWIGSRA